MKSIWQDPIKMRTDKAEILESKFNTKLSPFENGMSMMNLEMGTFEAFFMRRRVYINIMIDSGHCYCLI